MEIVIKSTTGAFLELLNPVSYTNDADKALIFDESSVNNGELEKAVGAIFSDGTYTDIEIRVSENATDLDGVVTVNLHSLGVNVAPTASTYARFILNEIKKVLVNGMLAGNLSKSLSKGLNATSKNTTSANLDEDKLLEQVSEDLKVATIVKPKETLDDYICEKFLKDELEEIVSFFNRHQEYVNRKIKLPKGVLFKGLPGTGKTYAARCIAGTTDAIFINTTASALQGMYIGSGAENIRKVFNAAKFIYNKLNKGVIIFIDELDSLGSRDNRSGSASGEEDRTLNQLLAEISGFEDTENIMVIAATNYPEKLDDALLRSGRISRQINIGTPNFDQRLAMVQYYFKNFEIEDTNHDEIAEITEGCTPADIASIANESAILSVRQNTSKITLEQINETINRVLTSNILDPDPTKIVFKVAAHEAGHVMAEAIYNERACIKVTCLPYGETGGFAQHSTQNNYIPTESDILNRIRVLVAGRAAEEVLTGEVTVGASNDLQRAFNLLKNYYEVYHFKPYDCKDLDNIIQKKFEKIYEEVRDKFKTIPELNTLAQELYTKKTLYKLDIMRILPNIFWGGKITC